VTPRTYGVVLAVALVLCFASLLLAIGGGCALPAARTPRVDLTVEQQERQAVWIDVYCAGFDDASPIAPTFWASGGIVSDRHVLTARHVVDGCPGSIPRIRVRVPGDDQPYAMAWFRELRGDEVLLERADAGRWSWARRPRPGTAVLGDRVCAETAAPLRRRQCGDVKERYVRDVGHAGAFVRYEFDTTPGNSGSLLYDRLGHLVGVHSAHQPGSTRAYMVPIDWTRLP